MTTRRCLHIAKPGLGNVTTLDLNVATLAVNPTRTSRRWISTSQRQFYHSLEHREVRLQRRTVRFITPFPTSRRWIHSLSGTLRRWIRTSRCWICALSITSRCWVSTLRRWLLHPRERRDVAPVLELEASHFCPTLAHPCRNPIVPPFSPPSTTLLPLPLPASAHPHQPSATVPSLHHTSGCPNPCLCRLPVSSVSLWLGPT